MWLGLKLVLVWLGTSKCFQRRSLLDFCAAVYPGMPEGMVNRADV
jgi:hypothetical protein